jgi:hypothetical protein
VAAGGAQNRNDLERIIEAMRGRFLSDSQLIAGEVARLGRQVAAAPPSLREAVLAGVSEVVSAHQRLRARFDRLPAPAPRRFTIMYAVLEAQRTALQRLGSIARQLDEGQRADMLARASLLRLSGPARARPPRAHKRLEQDHRERRTNHGGHRLGRLYAEAIITSRGSRVLALLAMLAAGYVTTNRLLPPINIRVNIGTGTVEAPSRGRPSVPPPASHPEDPSPFPAPLAAALPPRPPPSAPGPPSPPARPARGAEEETPALVGEPPPVPSTDPLPGMAPPLPSAAVRLLPSTPSKPPSGGAAAAPTFVAVIFTHQDRPTAQRAFADLRQMHPALLKGYRGELQTVDRGDEKGIWHRVVLAPSGSQQQAATLCEKLAAAGYDRCWVKPY